MIVVGNLLPFRTISFSSKQLVSGMRAGNFRSSMRGTGYDFDQLRDYRQGDDVRFIDWKSSARENKLLYRQYCQEQSRTIHIIVDTSSSMAYAEKYACAAHLAAGLAVASQQSGDAVALHFMQERLQTVVPALAGKRHVHRIITYLNDYQPQPTNNRTDIGTALSQLVHAYPRPGMVWIVSDWLDVSFNSSLFTGLSQRYELGIIRIVENGDEEVLIGADQVEAEYGALDRCSLYYPANRGDDILPAWRQHQDKVFTQKGISICDCNPQKNYVETCINYIRRHF